MVWQVDILAAEEAGHEAGPHADKGASQAEQGGARQEEREELARAEAEGTQQTDLAAAFADVGEGQEADPDAGAQQQRRNQRRRERFLLGAGLGLEGTLA